MLGEWEPKRCVGRAVFLVVVGIVLAWGLLMVGGASAGRTMGASLYAASPLLVAGMVVSLFYWFYLNRRRAFGVVLAVFVAMLVASFVSRPLSVGWLPERSNGVPANPTELVMPQEPRVAALADNLQTPPRMSNWVFAMVGDAPDESIGYADYWQSARETLDRRVGDCEDKAILLASLLRAENFSEGKVFVVVGSIWWGGEWRGHTWVMLYDAGGKPYYLDPAMGLSMSENYFDFQVLAQFNDRVFVGVGL